jgi:hypothetical protein
MKLIVKKCQLATKHGSKKPTSKYVITLSINEMVGKLKVKRCIFSHSDEKLAVGTIAADVKRPITWRSPDGFDWLIGAE